MGEYGAYRTIDDMRAAWLSGHGPRVCEAAQHQEETLATHIILAESYALSVAAVACLACALRMKAIARGEAWSVSIVPLEREKADE